MKMSRRNNQSGFTLIEVSLAIVIGVIVLAGAITLYNQSKVSAGNSKAQEKVLALATLAEELAANNGGAYPDIVPLAAGWTARRDDAGSSPWGGQASPSIFAADWSAGATFSATAASAGVMVYAKGSGALTVTDVNLGATRSFSNFLVGIIPPNGGGAAFIQGGR